MFYSGVRCGAVGWGTALQAGRSRVSFPTGLLRFFIDVIRRVDSVSNRNEYQKCFLEGKSGRCEGLTTLPPSCAVCLEIWEPQPSGGLRVSPGRLQGLLYLYFILFYFAWLWSQKRQKYIGENYYIWWIKCILLIWICCFVTQYKYSLIHGQGK